MPIRMAAPEDLTQLLDLIAPFRSPAFNWSERAFREEFDRVETWVLEVDQEVVAFVCLRDAVDAWEISVLASRAENQKQGHMKRLLTHLIELYNGKRHLWLEVHEMNKPAQRLYESLGFLHDGNRGGYYSDGSSALLYSLTKKTPTP